MIWRLEFSKAAAKDVSRVAGAGLKPKAQELLDMREATPGRTRLPTVSSSVNWPERIRAALTASIAWCTESTKTPKWSIYCACEPTMNEIGLPPFSQLHKTLSNK